jgi:hypothetical protein
MLRRHLTKESARNGKVMTDPTFAFQLQAYPNGHPPPTLLQKEVEMSSAAPFLLVNPGFSKMEVVKAYCHTIVTPVRAPVIHYWRQTIEIKKRDQVARMKAVRIFNPLHVMGNKVVVGDVDNFKFSQHPDIRPCHKGGGGGGGERFNQRS